MNNLNENNVFFSLKEVDIEGEIEGEGEKNNDFEITSELFFDSNNDLDYNFGLDFDNINLQSYTVKDLLKICNYYDIEKIIKTAKLKKPDIISTIIYFESLPENFEIVQKRHIMWVYMHKLSNDVKMKKYIIWS